MNVRNWIRCALLGGVMLATTAQADDVQFFGTDPGLPGSPPFSSVVRAGNTWYLAGQLGIVPGTRQLPEGGIRPETRQTMENIRNLLAEHGLSMNDVVKCLVMLADMDEWGTFNEEYRPFFPNHFPARSAFGASGLALGARVEVECIAYKDVD